MSKKQATAPAECLKMNIELADNGIIIRNPESEDEVTLALSKDNGITGLGHKCRHDDEYKAIGQKIFDWLCDVVIEEHQEELIITNFDIDIKAVAKGMDFAQ